MDYRIVKADIADAAEILNLQKSAYQIEAERYHDDSIAPLRQTLPELEGQFRDHTILKAVLDNRIVGTVRACEKGGTCYVGRLAVDPVLHNRGIGAALLEALEKACPAPRYELFAGSKSANNIHLYRKLGYVIYEKKRYGHGTVEVVYMEKTGAA